VTEFRFHLVASCWRADAISLAALALMPLSAISRRRSELKFRARPFRQESRYASSPPPVLSVHFQLVSTSSRLLLKFVIQRKKHRLWRPESRPLSLRLQNRCLLLSGPQTALIVASGVSRRAMYARDWRLSSCLADRKISYLSTYHRIKSCVARGLYRNLPSLRTPEHRRR
jgi:hypothetical protein